MKTFDQFITEGEKKPHDEVMKTISNNWNKKNKGSNFNVQHRPATDDGKQREHIYLGLIDVKPEERGKKKGKRFVKGITNYADRNKLPVSVKPGPEKGREKDLDRFYRNAGFEDNKKKDVAPHPMIRKPKDS